MAIHISANTPGGVSCAYHRVVKSEADHDSRSLTALIQSWPTRDGFVAGAAPEYWAFELGFDAFPDIEAALVDQPGACVFGGEVVADESASMDAARAAKWAALRRQRDVLDAAPIVVDGIAIDADERSRMDIWGAVLAMQATGQAERQWRSSDNVMRTLTLAQITQAGVAVDGRRQWLIDQTDALSQALAAATDVDAIQAIAWPPVPVVSA